MRVFISYARDNIPQASALAADLSALGHEAWFDRELAGGQAWWDQILIRIRECDAFVFALSPESLESPACDREWRYGSRLGKNILPALISGEISDDLLPPLLAAIQYVDYRQQDKQAVLRLTKALTALPAPRPLPDPLPLPPEVPTSYLGSLREQIQTAANLSFPEQTAILVTLKQGLREAKKRDEIRNLLRSLRARGDLLARVADEIDELLQDRGATVRPSAAQQTDLADAREKPTGRAPISSANSADREVALRSGDTGRKPFQTVPLAPTPAPGVGGHLGTQAPTPGPPPTAAPRPIVFPAVLRTTLIWGGGALVSQAVGALIWRLGFSFPFPLAWYSAAYSIIGALSFAFLLKWFGNQPRRVDYLRGGAAWLAATLISVGLWELCQSIGLGPYIAHVASGAAFGASGGVLTLIALRMAGAALSVRGRTVAVLGWCAAFALATLVGPVSMADPYMPWFIWEISALNRGSWVWVSVPLLRALSWAVGTFALFTIEVGARLRSNAAIPPASMGRTD